MTEMPGQGFMGSYLFLVTIIWWFIIAHARNSTPVDAIICFSFIFFSFFFIGASWVDSNWGIVDFDPLISITMLGYLKGMEGRG